MVPRRALKHTVRIDIQTDSGDCAYGGEEQGWGTKMHFPKDGETTNAIPMFATVRDSWVDILQCQNQVWSTPYIYTHSSLESPG